MLKGFGGEQGMVERSERCKRDYEKEIAQLKKRLNCIKDLHDALFNYLSEYGLDGHENERMAYGLLGATEVTQGRFTITLSLLMEEYEKEGKL